MNYKLVTIIVPCRNEVRHIEDFIINLFNQNFYDLDVEIIIADGASEDGTSDILKNLALNESRLHWVNNPAKIVSTGLNLAIGRARGDVIIRMDVHTRYAADYVYKCVVALANSEATCVGGAWVAKGFTPLQRIIAAAFQSKVGSGGAVSREINFSGWVDTVYLGAWRRHELLQLGCFDEALVRNQDDELCLRIHRSGGRVWQSNEIHSTYIPRESFKSLYMQFSQYGYWKIPVIQKHKIPASFRHLAPFVFLLLLTSLTLASFFMLIASAILFVVILMYIVGLYLGTKDQFFTLAPNDPRWLTLVVVAIMHLGYAVGFARAILDFIILRRDGRKSMTNLTR